MFRLPLISILMFNLSKVDIGLRVDPVQELIPSWHHLLQPAHRILWQEASAEQGRVNLHGSSGSSVCANWRHLCSSPARLLQRWIAAPSRRRDLGDARARDSSKYAAQFPYIAKRKKLVGWHSCITHVKNNLADATVYNAYLDGLLKARCTEKAVEVYQRMKRERCRANTETFTLMINVYGKVRIQSTILFFSSL